MQHVVFTDDSSVKEYKYDPITRVFYIHLADGSQKKFYEIPQSYVAMLRNAPNQELIYNAYIKDCPSAD